MWTGSFWKASLERAVKTFLQTYFAVALAGDAILNVFTFTWTGPELGIAFGATLLSLVTSVLSGMGGNPGPSLTSETIVPQVVERARPTP